MDSPQYLETITGEVIRKMCFKPYYKWIGLNTK